MLPENVAVAEIVNQSKSGRIAIRARLGVVISLRLVVVVTCYWSFQCLLLLDLLYWFNGKLVTGLSELIK